MRAVIYDGQPGAYRLAVDYSEPMARAGEARVRIALAGICNTDLEIVQGYAQFQGILGHEFVGVVDQADDPKLVGRRVVGEINIFCGTCRTCLAGWNKHCPNRTALGIRGHDGTLAEYVCLPSRNLHLVPDNVPDEAAVFAEPLAAACEVLDQVHVGPSQQVVVLGDGKLGLLIAQVLALTGCDLTVVGHHEEKLALLAARGISTEIDTPALARNADLVVECTGRADGFQAARECVRPGGTLVLKSTYHGRVETDLSSLVVDEIYIVGSRCGPFPAALRLLAQGLINVKMLIEAEYPLAQALAAFEHAGRRGALKVLVHP
jgi:threonine dehydrogenase-like Zn-dependent dehydrogenase